MQQGSFLRATDRDLSLEYRNEQYHLYHEEGQRDMVSEQTSVGPLMRMPGIRLCTIVFATKLVNPSRLVAKDSPSGDFAIKPGRQ